MPDRTAFLHEDLDALRRQGLYTTIRRLDGPQGPWLTVDGRRIDQVRIEPAPANDGGPNMGRRRTDSAQGDARADNAQPAAPGALTYLPTDPQNRWNSGPPTLFL